jgi:hypothetical protein
MFRKRRAIPPKKNFTMPASHGLPVGRKATVDKHIEYPKTRGLTVSFHAHLCSPRNDPKHQPKPVLLLASRTPPMNASRSEMTTRLLQNPDPTRLLLRRTRALLDRSPKAIRFSRPHPLQHPETRQSIHPASTNPKERFVSIDKPSNVENPSSRHLPHLMKRTPASSWFDFHPTSEEIKFRSNLELPTMHRNR